MLKRLLATVILAFAAVSAQAEVNYTVLANPSKVAKPGMIEVREFFWYGCSHCYKLEPYLDKWLQTKPADVVFIRTPAALNPMWEANARGYYTAEALGIVEKSHAGLFKAIHVGNQQLFDMESLTRFYAGFGADPKNFSGLYNSFAVSGKVGQSKALAQRYQLDGVPAIVVNGKYLVKGGPDKVMATLNEVIVKERAAAHKKAK